MTGTAAGVAKMRLIGDPETAKAVADLVVDMLEEAGYEIIEWSPAYPCKAPEEDRVRVYVTAMVKQKAE
jgi:hypothetical protein